MHGSLLLPVLGMLRCCKLCRHLLYVHIYINIVELMTIVNNIENKVTNNGTGIVFLTVRGWLLYSEWSQPLYPVTDIMKLTNWEWLDNRCNVNDWREGIENLRPGNFCIEKKGKWVRPASSIHDVMWGRGCKSAPDFLHIQSLNVSALYLYDICYVLYLIVPYFPLLPLWWYL